MGRSALPLKVHCIVAVVSPTSVAQTVPSGPVDSPWSGSSHAPRSGAEPSSRGRPPKSVAKGSVSAHWQEPELGLEESTAAEPDGGLPGVAESVDQDSGETMRTL